MNHNPFFKPTPLYKEFLVLDLIEKHPSITQREISEEIGSSVSMVNAYIDQYEKEGYLKRHYTSKIDVEYRISKKGREQRKLLNINYLKGTQTLYNSAKENIETFILQLESKGFHRILLYGAGEVAEILLHAIKSRVHNLLTVVGIIDDDTKKIGLTLADVPIIARSMMHQYTFDGILVSSYTNREQIKHQLQLLNYPSSNILEFFD